MRERERRTVLRKREKEKDVKEGGERVKGEEAGCESADEFDEDDDNSEGEDEEEDESVLVVSGEVSVQGKGDCEDERDGEEEDEEEQHFGNGHDMFGCGSSRNDARFKF